MFNENNQYPIQFPLILTQPMILYQELSEGQGNWSQIKYLEFQIPSKWDNQGEIVDHRSYFIFNADIMEQFQVNQERDQLQRDSQQSSDYQTQNSVEQQGSKYETLKKYQKAQFINTNFAQRSEILVTYSTDLHFCNKFSYLNQKPYCIEYPPDKKVKEYKFIFFKRYTAKEELLLDIIGFPQTEHKLDSILSFLIQKLLYEARYSKEGIKKQVEDQVEYIFIQCLKEIIRYLGQVLDVKDYKRMFELTYLIFVQRREEFYRIFELHQQNNHFCTNIRILKREIKQLVYKILISEGLFPIHCEINTMNDSYIKLKLLSLIADSEILPWSPKFHASLGLGNFHYSFTPNDLFNLRTMKQRKYHKKYEYIRMRILDFFPLDTWVKLISLFFEDNLNEILSYISQYMGKEDFWRMKQDIKDDEIQSNLNMKNTLNEPLLQKNTSEEFPKKNSISFTQEFKPKQFIQHTPSIFQNENDEEMEQQLQLFKKLLKKAIHRVSIKQNIYDIVVETPFIQKIKTQIADEFYLTYHYELGVTSILGQFCAIITETEMRSYSTMMNNCQTPVAAFIYMICDKFRPYSESLGTQTQFLTLCQQDGFQVKLQKVDPLKRSRSNTAEKFILPLNYRKSLILQNLKEDSKSIQQSQYFISDFEFLLQTYLSFGSCQNIFMQKLDFIYPAVLDQCLDFFGFYGDSFSRQYLKNIQKIDGQISQNPQLINKSIQFLRRFSQSDSVQQRFQFEELNFQKALYRSQDEFFKNYHKIMQKYELQQNELLSLSFEMKLILDGCGYLNAESQERLITDPLHLHYLVINYQNKLIQLKQEDNVQASHRHEIKSQFREASFYYYNSIRLQLCQKERRNTLSYIGFLLGKDVSSFSKEIPQNITLQTIV